GIGSSPAGPFLPRLFRRAGARFWRRPYVFLAKARSYADRVEEPLSPDAMPAPAASPYRNLFVPLIVVPAVIVGAILLVFLFFGAITGREASLSENIDKVITGGQAERKQAAFNMVRQIAENREAQGEGHSAPWPVEADFLPKLRRAWESTSAG